MQHLQNETCEIYKTKCTFGTTCQPKGTFYYLTLYFIDLRHSEYGRRGFSHPGDERVDGAQGVETADGVGVADECQGQVVSAAFRELAHGAGAAGGLRDAVDEPRGLAAGELHVGGNVRRAPGVRRVVGMDGGVEDVFE